VRKDKNLPGAHEFIVLQRLKADDIALSVKLRRRSQIGEAGPSLSPSPVFSTRMVTKSALPVLPERGDTDLVALREQHENL
jgi:hypothetical protein